MWILGGWNHDDDPTTNSQVWSSGDGVTWRLETVAPWEGRHCAGYAVHRDKMWIVGGDNNLYHYQNDVWSSDDGVTWTQVASDVPWRDRVTQYVLAFNDRLWVLGGQQITYFDLNGGKAVYNDVWSSEDGATWTRVLEHRSTATDGVDLSGQERLNQTRGRRSPPATHLRGYCAGRFDRARRRRAGVPREPALYQGIGCAMTSLGPTRHGVCS
jgi:hypothetical protein